MKSNLYIFGEVLFDIYPDGSKTLGGAPFNVAWHLQAFQQCPLLISRIGKDYNGEAIKKAVLEWGMNISCLQIDETLPTGSVKVTFTESEPNYEIVKPVAYDNIQSISTNSPENSILYHGSLAIRAEQSKQSLQRIIDNNSFLIFLDVNLRRPWWNKPSMHKMLERADWAKLNNDELDLLYPGQGTSTSRLDSFVHTFNLQGVVLTHGAKGAEILTADNQHFVTTPDNIDKIADTVGAGDAFSSIVVLGLKNKWPLSKTTKRAQEFASTIVRQRGAIINEHKYYDTFMKDWNL